MSEASEVVKVTLVVLWFGAPALAAACYAAWHLWRGHQVPDEW